MLRNRSSFLIAISTKSRALAPCRGCSTGIARMGYWLLKTEPGEWGWEHQERNGGLSHWDGVRSAQAQGHLRSMRRGDHAFFYHSGRPGPAVVGIVEVARAAYPDASDASGRRCMVDVRALALLPHPVPLSVIRADAAMRDWVLLRQSRLSVMPVSPSVWARVCELGELLPPPCANADDDDTAREDASSDPEVMKEQKKRRVKDMTSEEVPKKRARRLAGKAKEVEDNVKEEEASLASGVVELKTYQRVSRRKVGVVEDAGVIAPQVSKRRSARKIP